MVLSVLTLPIVLLITLVESGNIVPDACSPVKVVCVGEGESCLYDQYDHSCEGKGNTYSTCPVCSSSDLTCHNGFCIRHIGKVGDVCSASGMTSNRIRCKPPLECVGSRCAEIDSRQTRLARGRGEECDPVDDLCQSTLQCDINHKCAWPVCKRNNRICNGFVEQEGCEEEGCTWTHPEDNFMSDNSNRRLTCGSIGDCPWGQYCDNMLCLDSIPIGQRLYAPCVDDNTVGDRQCGHGMSCEVKNEFEEPGHSTFQDRVCKFTRPFNVAEGERCVNSNYCGKGMICSNSVCSRPDRSRVGEGCNSDNECGRGMLCRCPDFGDASGGRKRCIVDPVYAAHDRLVDREYKYTRPWENCKNTKKCNSPACEQKHCLHLLQARQDYDTSNTIYCSAPAKAVAAYEGMQFSGSIQSITLSVVWSVVVIFSFWFNV